jgi:hypothetical protein
VFYFYVLLSANWLALLHVKDLELLRQVVGLAFLLKRLDRCQDCGLLTAAQHSGFIDIFGSTTQ